MLLHVARPEAPGGGVEAALVALAPAVGERRLVARLEREHPGAVHRRPRAARRRIAVLSRGVARARGLDYTPDQTLTRLSMRYGVVPDRYQ